MKYQGEKEIACVPERSGIYAWYYKPLVTPSIEEVFKVLSAFVEAPKNMRLDIDMEYGIRMRAVASMELVYGKSGNSLIDQFKQSLSFSDFLLTVLLKLGSFPNFSSPLYVGIAKNLRRRIYEEHYKNLIDLWDEECRVSKYLFNNKDAKIEDIMRNLGEEHSFALEARVREISPRDLMVFIFPANLPDEENDKITSELESKNKIRALEQSLHFISRPVFGKR